MDFRILGPVQVCVDGRRLAVTGKQRALLAVLLLENGEPVTRDRLVEDLWGEDAPEGAPRNAQVIVSRLRAALGGEAGRLVTGASGYRLRVDPDELDVARFQRLCDEGRRALAGGRPERAALRWRAALDEWRGPALADVAREPFAQAEAMRLEGLRTAALEARIEADLAMGRGAELVNELEALVAREPFRERLREHLMLALYRAGRRGEALDAYREAARTLDAGLGLQPGPGLRRLQQEILADDPRLPGPMPVAEAPPGERERRRATATILFTDLARSTPMREQLGDEGADAVRREHDRRLRDVLAGHGGREVKALGDGLMATFGAAGAAIDCAVEMQRAIDRQATRSPVALGMRIGVGVGDVIWEDDDCHGTAVVQAQRLCAAAGGGQILVADAVRQLAGSRAGAAFEDAGPMLLRGLETPVQAWRLAWTAERKVAVPLAPGLARDPNDVFVGRTAELTSLRSAWGDAVAGRRRGILICGEPGIGKTRLAAEAAAWALNEGGVVLYGRCDDGLAAPAQPVVQALGAYTAACPVDELRVQLGRHVGDLAGLLPGLIEQVPGVTEPALVAPDVEQLRTLDAAVALLERAGDGAPVLLVLDDLHWADELSLLFLRHVLRAERGMRLLVLATYRDTEPSRSGLLGDVITGLARQADVARMQLGPLGETDIEAILAHAGRRRALAGRIRAATEGNPFFVGEVVQTLEEDGADLGTALTPRVRDVVHARIGRLPQEAADALTVAAVVGAEFDADIVAAAAGVDLERVLDALDAAEFARLVRPAGALDRFTFAHALVRDTILADLPAGRGIRWHARIARALEQTAATRRVTAAELAAHFASAGTLVDAASTLRHARQAGDEASAQLAFDLAGEQYERALRAQARLPNAPIDQRLELQLAHARALRLAGDERGEDLLRQAAAAAEAAGDGARMADALLAVQLDNVDFFEEDVEMVDLLRRALVLLPAERSPVRARLEACLAAAAVYSLRDSERRAMAERALVSARRTGDHATLASVLTYYLWTVMGPADLPERLVLADELVAMGRLGLPYAESDGHNMRFWPLVGLGRRKEADAALAAARATARVPSRRWTTAQVRTVHAVLAGRLDEAEGAAVGAVEIAREARFPPAILVQASLVRMLACIRFVQGRMRELEDVAHAMLQDKPDQPPGLFLALARSAQERDDRDASREAFEQAVARGLLEQPHGLAWPITLSWAADVCTWLEDRPRASSLHDLLSPHSAVMIAQSGPIGRAVGRLALTLGRRDEAERLLRDAVALCQRMDARAHLAIARHDLGRLLLPSDEGRRLVDQARTAADELGIVGVARLGAAL